MENKLVKIERLDGIVNLSLDRPEKHNAMNGQLVDELLEMVKDLSHDPSVRLIMMSGKGENFCSGGDIHGMQSIGVGAYADNYQDAYKLADLLFNIYHFPKPTIALAHGMTLGAGLGLLSACDIVLVSENATFGFSEVRIGIAPSVISPYVVAAIGERIAQYYFLTGNHFDAVEAHRIGLAHQVVKEEALLSTSTMVAKRLLLNGPNALTEAKSLIRLVSPKNITIDLAKVTAGRLANLRASSEAQEGLKAFIEKRDPKWER